ncbi:MAG: CAP domain-containing protein [Candidatus Hadarchaeales archaeon]
MLEDNLLTLSTCIFDATNHEREKVGLPSLSWDEELARIARAHSAEMASQKQLFHVSPDGKGPLDRYREAGYGLCSLSPEMGAIYLCGENVAKVFVVRATLVEPYVGKIWEHDLKGIEEIAAEAMFAWLRSPEHKEAILSPGFTRLGVGVFLEKEEGAVYITQNFS